MKKVCPDCKTELEEKEYEDTHEGEIVYGCLDICPKCGVVVYDYLEMED